MTHYNIAKKQEINPFDGVNYVRLSSYSQGEDILSSLLNQCDVVETRKINGRWTILYPLHLLDFVTLISWISPLRGKFQYRNKSIHFIIEDDVMVCW